MTSGLYWRTSQKAIFPTPPRYHAPGSAVCTIRLRALTRMMTKDLLASTLPPSGEAQSNRSGHYRRRDLGMKAKETSDVNKVITLPSSIN